MAATEQDEVLGTNFGTDAFPVQWEEGERELFWIYDDLHIPNPVSPLFFGAASGWILLLSVVWGAAVIADSGVFSTSLSEVADHRYVGTALTAQTAIGFALTVVTIQFVPVLADAVGWRWAFWLLVPGPVVGAIAMRSFGRRSTRVV